jgi:hypothetical protein
MEINGESFFIVERHSSKQIVRLRRLAFKRLAPEKPNPLKGLKGNDHRLEGGLQSAPPFTAQLPGEHKMAVIAHMF